MGRVVAIDGPSGAGKSTVAKLLADMLGFNYLDTGALYRAVAMGLVQGGVEIDDTDGVIEDKLKEMTVSFKGDKVYLDGQDVSDGIRTPEMGHFSSVFSARRPVRDFLLPVQQRAAEVNDLVAEGRDMTTVVFPDAWRKFYLDATMTARAMRRYHQLKSNGVPITTEDAINDVDERDRRDTSRDISPLRVADDAVVINSSNMTLKEVMKEVLSVVKHGAPEA